MTQPHRDEVATPIGSESGATVAAEVRRQVNRQMRAVLDHLWGPTGSIIIHVFVLIFLIFFVKGEAIRRTVDLEVMIVEPETTNLEELEKLLEQPREVQLDIRPPDADITLQQPPDVQPVTTAHMPDEFVPLDIRADVKSPLIMKGLYQRIDPETRRALGQRFGGRVFPLTEAAVIKALEWLKERQLPDGSWQGESAAQSKTAMTGLALLTFLAHGETPSSERYGPTVEKAIRFLVEDWAGDRFRNVDGNWYGHGIATYALCEAYSLTRIPAVKTVAEQAVARILRGQQETGAFNYRLRSTDVRRDTSVMGWMGQALKAAYLAGLDVPGLREAMEKAVNGFKINFDPERRMFAYAPGGEGPEGGLQGRLSNTCMAVLTLQLFGHGGSPEAKAGFESMRGMSADYNNAQGLGNWPMYVWYYATQAHFHVGGSVWNEWNNIFARSFVNAQNADGSWTPIHGNERNYGPVYGTCFAALSLMVYYRFLPTYQPIQIEEVPTQKSDDDVRVEVSLAPSRPDVLKEEVRVRCGTEPPVDSLRGPVG